MGPARIGINALYLIPGGVGGTEIYLRNLLSAMALIDSYNHYFVFTNSETGSDLVPAEANFHHVPQRVRASIRPARILWEQTVLPFETLRRRIQVLFNPGFTAPLAGPCPNVTVFHDLQHKRHPEHFRWFDLPFWRVLLYGAVHRSRSLIAMSETTGSDLARFYQVPPDRIHVVPHGVEEQFFAIAQRRTPERFLLCVSTLHPHKNLDTLLRAFLKFSARVQGFRLIIAGLRGFYAEELERQRSSLGLDNSVVFTGWIPRDQLYDLFSRASAFVYPSTFEGFGMPVLEAMAAGLPTACSGIEPLRSMVGSAALTFDPHDPEAMCGALVATVSDEPLRQRLAREGPARAAQFTWQASARATLETLLAAI